MKIVFLTVHDDAATVLAAAEAGARGYILKGVSGSELVEALLRIAGEEAVVFPEIHGNRAVTDFRSDRRMLGSETDVGRATRLLTRGRVPA